MLLIFIILIFAAVMGAMLYLKKKKDEKKRKAKAARKAAAAEAAAEAKEEEEAAEEARKQKAAADEKRALLKKQQDERIAQAKREEEEKNARDAEKRRQEEEKRRMFREDQRRKEAERRRQDEERRIKQEERARRIKYEAEMKRQKARQEAEQRKYEAEMKRQQEAQRAQAERQEREAERQRQEEIRREKEAERRRQQQEEAQRKQQEEAQRKQEAERKRVAAQGGGISTNGRCGPSHGKTRCPGAACCSSAGWCGGRKGKRSAWCAWGPYTRARGHWSGKYDGSGAAHVHVVKVAKAVASGTGRERSTRPNHWGGGNSIFLDRHNVDCGNKALQGFHLRRPRSNQINYKYQCGGATTGASIHKNSGTNHWGGGHTLYLDRHRVDCGPNPLHQFKLVRPHGSAIRYNYKCGNRRHSGRCRRANTGFNQAHRMSIYLDRHKVRCHNDEVLKKFKLNRQPGTGWPGKMRYDYECCKI